MTRYGFNVEHTEDALRRLEESPQVFNDLVAYLRTNRHSGLSVQGHDIDDLMLNYGLSPIGAYLMLSDLVVNPSMDLRYLDEIKDDARAQPRW